MVVKQELESMGMQPLHVSMGEAELKKQPSAKQMEQLNSRLLQLGFEILDDKKQKQIENADMAQEGIPQRVGVERYHAYLHFTLPEGAGRLAESR